MRTILTLLLALVWPLAHAYRVTFNTDALLLEPNLSVFGNLTSVNLLNNTVAPTTGLTTGQDNSFAGMLLNFRGTANPQPLAGFSNIAVVNGQEVSIEPKIFDQMRSMNVIFILAYNVGEYDATAISRLRLTAVITVDDSIGEALSSLIDQLADSSRSLSTNSSDFSGMVDQVNNYDSQGKYTRRLYARVQVFNSSDKQTDSTSQSGSSSNVGTAAGLGSFGGVLIIISVWMCYRLRRRRRIVTQERRERRNRGIDSLASILRGVKVAPLNRDHLAYLRKIKLTKENIISLGLQNAVSTIRSLREISSKPSFPSQVHISHSLHSQRRSTSIGSLSEITSKPTHHCRVDYEPDQKPKHNMARDIHHKSIKNKTGHTSPTGSDDEDDINDLRINVDEKYGTPDQDHDEDAHGNDCSGRSMDTHLRIPALMTHVTDSIRSMGSLGTIQQEKGYPSCTICLDRFRSGHYVRQLPCKHVFHTTCVDKWLITKSAVCPLCKFDCEPYCQVRVMFNKEKENNSVSFDGSELRYDD